jgi:histidinol-phosphatase
LKDELNPVTDADQAAETLIRQGIQTHFPTHAIQGEEQGETRPEGPLRWIVDPLDGKPPIMRTPSPILPSALRCGCARGPRRRGL